MKKHTVYLIFIFLSLFSWAQNPDAFITTWQVSEDDLSVEIIPTYHQSNQFNIDFGDGTTLINPNNYAQHTYAQPGIYTVTIIGYVRNIYFNTYDNGSKLRTVEQWGTNPWFSTQKMFENCPYIQINATDLPNLSNVTNMSEMFKGATLFNSPVEHWDVSNVQNFIGMFQDATSFNQPLNNWDTANILETKFMFYGASSFSQNLNNWDVSNVQIFHNMFSGATSFNGDVTSWDVSSAINMSGMFQNAQNFNQNIQNWNVSNVSSMSGMLNGALSFNQPLNNWDVSSLVNAANLFNGAVQFNQPLNNWNTQSLANANNTFKDAILFNQPLDNWNVSNLTNMAGMFSGTTLFNQNLSNWDVSSCINMSSMFYNATSFNQDLSHWVFAEWVNMTNFLSYSAMDLEKYDALLLRFYEQNLSNFNVGAHTLHYCDEQARNQLIGERNFLFTGDTLANDCEMNMPTNNTSNISIFPNPTDGFINFLYNAEFLVDKITVYNTLGQKVHAQTKPNNHLNIKHLDTGIYILILQSNSSTQTFKIFKR